MKSAVHLTTAKHLNQFENTILRQTPLVFVSNILNYNFQNIFHRNQVLFTLEKLQEIPLDQKPTFTFAHILTPHPPYIFNSDGTTNKHVEFSFFHQNKLEQHTISYLKPAYINQIEFINREILKVIDSIINNSDTPPVIILQSDHGPAITINWDNPTEQQIRERMANLNAILLPTPDYDKEFYGNISPVNNFRLIFNKLFNTNYELLEDKSYFTNYQNPFVYKEVPSINQQNSPK